MRSLTRYFLAGFFLLLAVPTFAQTASAAQVDYEKDFLTRYDLIITPDEKKAFKKLATNEERNKFIEDFWTQHDLDPNTPENEFKNLIDERIKDVVEDTIFWGDIDIRAFRFANNGGMKKDTPAHVYIRYGKPHWKREISSRTNKFVDLMLWIYFDERGAELFRFLFYKRTDGYTVFTSQNPLDIYFALEKISNFQTSNRRELEEILNEMIYLIGPEAYPFLRALMNFSYYSDVSVDLALRPPVPASVIASQLRVLGLPPKIKNETVPSSDSSLIVVSLRPMGNGRFFFLTRYMNVDWAVIDDKTMKCFLKLRIFFQNKNTKETHKFETGLVITVDKALFDPDNQKSSLKEAFEDYKDRGLVIEPPGLQEFFAKLPDGQYLLKSYLKNLATHKAVELWLEVSK